MSDELDWSEVRNLLDALYAATDRLETIFPGRKFSLDGHLVGSIGEVLAAYMFDLDLFRGSTKGHDAAARGGRSVEVKLTQQKSVAIRHQPDHLIVLRRERGKPLEVVYNGPGKRAWDQAGKKQSNGQRPIGVAKLRALMLSVAQADRLRQIRPSPI